jgi:hypothetical protein
MHHIFQRDLLAFRVKAAKTFLHHLQSSLHAGTSRHQHQRVINQPQITSSVEVEMNGLACSSPFRRFLGWDQCFVFKCHCKMLVIN